MIAYLTQVPADALVDGPTADLYDANLRNMAEAVGQVRVLSLTEGRPVARPHPRIEGVLLVSGSGDRPLTGARAVVEFQRLWQRWLMGATLLYLPSLSALVLPALAWRVRTRARVSVRFTWNPVWVADATGDSVARRLRWRAVQRLAFRCVDAVGCGTPELADAAVASGADPRKVWLTPNFVDLPAEAEKQNFAAGPRLRCVGVGRLVDVKNFETLVEAAARLRDGVEVDIVGEGPRRARLEARIRELDAPVRLLGALPHGALLARLADWDAYVQPSLAEGTPKALLEAMRIGLPCVGNRVPGITSLLDGGRGALFDGTVDGLAAALARLAGSEAERERLGRAGREHVRQSFAREDALARDRSMVLSLVGARSA